MSLQAFIAEANGNGISRDNRFSCEGRAVPPEPLNGFIQTASLPGIQFHTGLYRNYGHGTNYINNSFYDDLTLTFFDTGHNDITDFYNEWIGEIYQNGQLQFKDDYVRDMTIYKLNRENERVTKYIFDRVFPTNVSDVPLNTAGANSPSILTVTFSYDEWR